MAWIREAGISINTDHIAWADMHDDYIWVQYVGAAERKGYPESLFPELSAFLCAPGEKARRFRMFRRG